jgi:hypothetical protein
VRCKPQARFGGGQGFLWVRLPYPTLQIVVKLALHIGRQAFGIGIGVERGEKGFEMFRDHFIEHRWSSPSRCSGGEGLLLTVRVGPLLRPLSGPLVYLRGAQRLPDAFGG